MKYRLLIPIVAFIFWACTGKSAAATVSPDTLSKPWRLNKQEFLKRYGDNEKVKKFITAWFTTRYVSSALSAATGIATGVLIIDLAPYAAGGNAYAALSLVLVGFTGTLMTIIFLIPFLTHSRKKLYKILEKYKNRQEIPRRFRRQLSE
jgi:hypothetical protein